MRTLIKNGTIVTAAESYPADLLLVDGKIALMGQDLPARPLAGTVAAREPLLAELPRHGLQARGVGLQGLERIAIAEQPEKALPVGVVGDGRHVHLDSQLTAEVRLLQDRVDRQGYDTVMKGAYPAPAGAAAGAAWPSLRAASTEYPRDFQAASPPSRGRTRTIPRCRSRSATRALVASLGQVQ